MDYNEQKILTDYIWQNYAELLTDFEHLVGMAIREQTPEIISSSPRPAPAKPGWAYAGDPQVAAALREGPHHYRHRVRDRLLHAYPERIVITRCPKCKRIASRPGSEVCFWCGHDWHARKVGGRKAEGGK